MPYELDKACQASREDLIRNWKRCWCPDCPYAAWFEDWGGWRWCLRHAWREIRINETWGNKWFEFRKMKIRNPYWYPFK